MPAFDLSLALALAIIFGAAVVRGFSGFGFSLLAIGALSLIYPVRMILAPIFMMELAASINLLPAIWRDIHWRSLLPLIVGCLVGTPIGVWLLSQVAPAPMTVALGIFVLVATFLLWRGYRLQSMPNLPATIASGIASGMANGAFGIGGPPVIIFYFSSPAGAAAGRASLAAYFLAIDIIGLSFLSGMAGLVTKQSVILAAIFLPVLLIGIWIGHRSFKKVDEAAFRKIVLAILAVLGAIILLKGVSQL